MIKWAQFRDPDSFNDIVAKRELTYKIAKTFTDSGVDIDDVELVEVEPTPFIPEDYWFAKNGWEIVKSEVYLEHTLLNTVYRGMSKRGDETIYWYVEKVI